MSIVDSENIQNDEANRTIMENIQKEKEALIMSQSVVPFEEKIDPILNLIKLIRNAKTDEEAKKILMDNIDILLNDERVRYLIDHGNVEGPNDDYLNKKRNVMFEDDVDKMLSLIPKN